MNATRSAAIIGLAAADGSTPQSSPWMILPRATSTVFSGIQPGLSVPKSGQPWQQKPVTLFGSPSVERIGRQFDEEIDEARRDEARTRAHGSRDE
jgi:hypothetical protein